MMKTIDWKLCEKPFKLEEHDMQKKKDKYVAGTVFIRKAALRQRFNEIDPSWSLTPPEILSVTGDVILVRGGLTLGGITRYDVGTGIIQTTKWNDKTHAMEPLSAYEQARALAMAFKTAVANLIPRCAINWNIGAYLKDAKEIANPTELKTFLDKLSALSIPPHWALNGYGEAFKTVMQKLGLSWKVVAAELEPGLKLDKLSDTTLDFPVSMTQLLILAAIAAKDKAAPPAAPDPVPAGSPANPTQG